ncbi:hypothetical protein OG725_37190 (plasmid) [Streptomyces sp. NBC_01213]|uniref:hypothetical protein n=1 Tax=Streptomyces sp. NBC_01213 TaxID=2903776 RepID=UPI002F9072B9|nr:hypothetical protein OG725_37190 [Streptomyces sp. NBC_01213]
MTTQRLNSLALNGTTHVPVRVHLADGHLLDVLTGPGSAWVQEVHLFPGLRAPDAEGWENEDRVELFLLGENLGGRLFLDVPVSAVRDLIEQHGGEHADQSWRDWSVASQG